MHHLNNQIILSLLFFSFLSSVIQLNAHVKCSLPSYSAIGHQIFAVDPNNNKNKVELKIKGVNWSGMETSDRVLSGLWGRENGTKILGSSLRKIVHFLSKNKFNSVRIPLNVQAILEEETTFRTELIHKYDNPELANCTSYLSLLQQVIKTFQTQNITVLLDLHTLRNEEKDALWYIEPYTIISETPIYACISKLAKLFCNDSYWNILGIDLKNQPYKARWDSPDRTNSSENWRLAASELTNRMIKLCPNWLAFVEGVGSQKVPDDYHKVSPEYDYLIPDWFGSNLRSAGENPLQVDIPGKIVYAPHVYSHGVHPQQYFYTIDSKCELNMNASERTSSTPCIDFDENNNRLEKPIYNCSTSYFSCKSVSHLSLPLLKANVEATADQQFGYLASSTYSDIPIVLGEFGGVFNQVHQPHQTFVIKTLIEYIIKHLNGGYYWSLNPESEFYLEDNSFSSSSGVFGRTHYGILSASDWEKSHKDLLAELDRLPSSTIPCFPINQVTTNISNTNHKIDQFALALSILCFIYYALPLLLELEIYSRTNVCGVLSFLKENFTHLIILFFRIYSMMRIRNNDNFNSFTRFKDTQLLQIFTFFEGSTR